MGNISVQGTKPNKIKWQTSNKQYVAVEVLGILASERGGYSLTHQEKW